MLGLSPEVSTESGSAMVQPVGSRGKIMPIDLRGWTTHTTQIFGEYRELAAEATVYFL